MKGLEELSQYDFHDSLLENIFYDKEKNVIVLKVDFCNWRQDWYRERYEETSEISLVFEHAISVEIPDITLNSDEIINVELLKMGEMFCGIKVVAFNDIKNISYEIVINAKSVTIKGIDKN